MSSVLESAASIGCVTSFDGHDLSATPFDESDLVVKDVNADLWVEGIERPRKRVRTHLRMGMLAEEIRKHGEAFNLLVARAYWRAEEVRAMAADAPMDESLALAGYEPTRSVGREAYDRTWDSSGAYVALMAYV